VPVAPAALALPSLQRTDGHAAEAALGQKALTWALWDGCTLARVRAAWGEEEEDA